MKISEFTVAEWCLDHKSMGKIFLHSRAGNSIVSSLFVPFRDSMHLLVICKYHGEMRLCLGQGQLCVLLLKGRSICTFVSEVIKLFSRSTQPSMKFIPLTNVKMPTIVGILTFISRINTPSECIKHVNQVNIFFSILVL